MAANSDNINNDEKIAIDPLDSAIIALRGGKYRESLGGVNPTGASAEMINERGERFS